MEDFFSVFFFWPLPVFQHRMGPTFCTPQVVRHESRMHLLFIYCIHSFTHTYISKLKIGLKSLKTYQCYFHRDKQGVHSMTLYY